MYKYFNLLHFIKVKSLLILGAVPFFSHFLSICECSQSFKILFLPLTICTMAFVHNIYQFISRLDFYRGQQRRQ